MTVHEASPRKAVTPPPHNGDMQRQLVLIDKAPRSWQLDERTREVGRKGLAEARRALASSSRTRRAA